MQALLVVDAQNEFSAGGLRAFPDHARALEQILRHVKAAREERRPIAWVQHHNRPHESKAFVPGTWGAELSPGLGPVSGAGPERIFVKDVYDAFTATELEAWLRSLEVTKVLIVGFYAHMCLATTAREALSRDFEVAIDPDATGAQEIEDPVLGRFTADEVRRSALAQLVAMGARIASPTARTQNVAEAMTRG
jgi:nicotinamidase-related amidase